MSFGSGRSEINTTVFKERVHREEFCFLKWRATWQWIIPEYIQLQEDLAKTNLPETGIRKFKDKRSLLPYPESVNHEYGWVAKKGEFRLEKYGPDVLPFPLNPPQEDGTED